MENTKAYIVPLSGGLDSTYLLYKLLKENPDYDFFVFHLNLIKGTENYHQQELYACRYIIKHLRSSFPGMINMYKEPTLDLRNMHCGLDTDGVLVVAQKILYTVVKRRKYEDVKLGIGLVPDDGNYARFRNQWMDGEGMNNRIWQCLLDSMIKRVNKVWLNKVDRKIQYPLYWENITKKDCIERLPKNILEYVWVCRKPKNGIPCRECGSCKTHMKALEEANV